MNRITKTTIAGAITAALITGSGVSAFAAEDGAQAASATASSTETTSTDDGASTDTTTTPDDSTGNGSEENGGDSTDDQNDGSDASDGQPKGDDTATGGEAGEENPSPLGPAPDTSEEDLATIKEEQNKNIRDLINAVADGKLDIEKLKNKDFSEVEAIFGKEKVEILKKAIEGDETAIVSLVGAERAELVKPFLNMGEGEKPNIGKILGALSSNPKLGSLATKIMFSNPGIISKLQSGDPEAIKELVNKYKDDLIDALGATEGGEKTPDDQTNPDNPGETDEDMPGEDGDTEGDTNPDENKDDTKDPDMNKDEDKDGSDKDGSSNPDMNKDEGENKDEDGSSNPDTDKDGSSNPDMNKDGSSSNPDEDEGKDKDEVPAPTIPDNKTSVVKYVIDGVNDFFKSPGGTEVVKGVIANSPGGKNYADANRAAVLVAGTPDYAQKVKQGPAVHTGGQVKSNSLFNSIHSIFG